MLLSTEGIQRAGQSKTALCCQQSKANKKNPLANQKDKLFLDMARDELNLGENMMRGPREATNQSSRAFEPISKSIESVGKLI